MRGKNKGGASSKIEVVLLGACTFTLSFPSFIGFFIRRRRCNHSLVRKNYVLQSSTLMGTLTLLCFELKKGKRWLFNINLLCLQRSLFNTFSFKGYMRIVHIKVNPLRQFMLNAKNSVHSFSSKCALASISQKIYKWKLLILCFL